MLVVAAALYSYCIPGDQDEGYPYLITAAVTKQASTHDNDTL